MVGGRHRGSRPSARQYWTVLLEAAAESGESVQGGMLLSWAGAGRSGVASIVARRAKVLRLAAGKPQGVAKKLGKTLGRRIHLIALLEMEAP